MTKTKPEKKPSLRGGYAIAIDLGGTKISWALVDGSYDILWRRQALTPPNYPDILPALHEIVAEALNSHPQIKGVGVGVAGLVDFAGGEIVAAPNLPLTGQPIKSFLESKFGIICRLDNDANLAALGELYRGAGRGRQSYIGLTIGTGVGGGMVIAGRLWRGAKGSAAEFGHMVIAATSRRCACGNYGCFETLASGKAIERLAKEAIEARPDSSLAKKAAAARGVSGQLVASAAREGDSEALAILVETAHWLGVGIGNLINIIDPELVIVGGGVASSLGLVLETIQAEAAKIVIDPRSRQTPVVVSDLDNNAGLYGAAALILDDA